MKITIDIDLTLNELEKMWSFPPNRETDEEQKIRMKRNMLILQIVEKVSEDTSLIGKTFDLDLGSSSPVSVTIKEITDTKVIVGYNDFNPGRAEEFSIDSFEYLSGLKIR
jgi:FKBP-type peptidyl-prolyl cis-trans isomerase 2